VISVRDPQPGEIAFVGQNAAEQWVRERFLAGGEFADLFTRPLTKVLVIDDIPVAAGGFIDQGNNAAIGWTLVGHVAQQHLFALCRNFRRQMELSPFHVIEAHCFDTFQASHRWVQCIGFRPIDGLFAATDGRPFRRFAFRNLHNGN
jgi:hypothetical protein